MDSIWTKAAKAPRFAPLEQDIKTDVLIIGGGIAGILCAHKLTRAGVRCVLLEADRICGGITQNTTAKLTLQHGLHYDGMLRRFGEDAAHKYLDAQKQALRYYQTLCEHIDCDYRERDAFVYSLTDRKEIEREVRALNMLGCPAEFREKVPLPFPIAGAVCVAHQAEFHPLKFLYALAKELPIYEKTKVLALSPEGALTSGGKVRARKTIVATHFPILNKHGLYFLKLYQHRSYVIALENTPSVEGMYVDASKTGLSFRNAGGLLLIGGGAHRTGKKGGAWADAEAFAARYYPNAKEVARWATQDCMTLDDVPYIGAYAKKTEDLYVATGFGKWGMTNAMVAANILCDLVQGKKNAHASVFSPKRSMLHPQLAINAVSSVLGLLTPTVPRCPHMGCALKYNAQEHSWDCPCHGSRFAEDGTLLDNPATDDKK